MPQGPNSIAATASSKMVAAPSADTKDKLDSAIEAYLKIKHKVGEKDVKIFLEATAVNGLLLRLLPQKDEDEKQNAAAAKAPEKRLDSVKGVDDRFTDTSGSDLKLPTRPPGFAAGYLTEGCDVKSTDNIDNPTTLTAAAWDEIFSTNEVFHGFLVDARTAFTRARYAAFEAKPTNEQIAAKKTILSIPEFHISDNSSITIKETRNAAELSMVSNGFSSNAIQTCISGDYGRFTTVASALNKNELWFGKSSSDFEGRKEYTACYTFPRAHIFLDEDNLKVTDACMKDLIAIKTVKEQIDGNQPHPDLIQQAKVLVQKFYAKYGTVFATTFLLGGQLTASKSTEVLEGANDTQRRDSMRWSAAVSLDAFGAPVSGSRERSSNAASHAFKKSSKAALAWSARGGNTLLAANPAAWTSSVASFHTWRSVEQDGICSLPQLLTNVLANLPADSSIELADKPDVREIFDTIMDHPVNGASISRDISSCEWSGKFMLETVDGRFIKWNGDKLHISRDRSLEGATVFCAVNADVSAELEPLEQLPKLLAGWPMFLPTKISNAGFQKKTSGVPGVWASEDGFIHREIRKKIITSTKSGGSTEVPSNRRRMCRWSLCPASESHNQMTSARWAPDSATAIRDGTEVKLYCHSYFSGAYRTTKEPPFFAPSVCYSRDDPENLLRLPRITNRVLRAAGSPDFIVKTRMRWKSEGVLKDLLSREDTGHNSLWNLFKAYDELATDVITDPAILELETMNELFGLSNVMLWYKYEDFICADDGDSKCS